MRMTAMLTMRRTGERDAAMCEGIAPPCDFRTSRPRWAALGPLAWVPFSSFWHGKFIFIQA